MSNRPLLFLSERGTNRGPDDVFQHRPCRRQLPVLKMKLNSWRYFILLADLVWIAVVLLSCRQLGPGYLSFGDAGHVTAHFTVLLMLSVGIWLLLYFALRLESDADKSLVETAVTLGLTSGMLGLLLGAAVHVTITPQPRLMFGLFSVFAWCGFFGVRWVKSALPFAANIRRIVIVGDGKIAAELARKIERHQHRNCRIVGLLAPVSAERSSTQRNEAVSTLEIPGFCDANRITDVILALPEPMPREVSGLVASCRAIGIRISMVPSHYELYLSRPSFTDLEGLPLVTLEELAPSRLLQGLKLATDRIAGVFLLLFTTPFLAVLALYLWQRRGKAFISERRCGKGGAIFSMYRLNVPRNGEKLSWVELSLLRTSLTELPQLCNVVQGDMSLVGPRPELPERVKHYSEWHRKRLAVRPGITGLAQVEGLRDEHSSEEKARFDLQYILHWSLWLDLKLVLQTLLTIVRRLHTEEFHVGSPRQGGAPFGGSALVGGLKC